jgi:dienelactone hydrolase
MKLIALFALVLFAESTLLAAVQTKEIKYKVGDVECVGMLAWDDAVAGKRPGVLVFHEWWGINDYAKSRTEQLAKLGYIAFAADLYGGGKVAEHPEDAGKMATTLRQSQSLWQQRATAALDILKSQSDCDAEKLAAIGYCFGGSTALQLAYSGADLKSVVTFHAALPTPSAEDAKKIKPSIVVCHGADDKFISSDDINKFSSALGTAGVDYEIDAYGGAVHGFSVPDADKRNMPGLKYNPLADARSWARMQRAFAEKLGK